jgi:hypothetical protein
MNALFKEKKNDARFVKVSNPDSWPGDARKMLSKI